ncbi:unnamed protein product [Moneuplotes crassus]|uniref:Uncharacterized protein n=1 Tax=Euplotes crassus TaxID=5936 RepID=A0AAD1XDW6_EUPCR|nr:unnamed protein product [Moneuplotes crassus]
MTGELMYPSNMLQTHGGKMFHPEMNYPPRNVEFYADSAQYESKPYNTIKNMHFKRVTRSSEPNENLIVGFRGTDVKEASLPHTSMEDFKPINMRNLKLSKKYFSKHHKNHSHFNAYSDYITNMEEFKKDSNVNYAKNLRKSFDHEPKPQSSTSRLTINDFSPGKQKLNDRDIQKLALQGMFDYPHNRVNNQCVENIDLKEADKKYYKRFKAHHDRNATLEDAHFNSLQPRRLTDNKHNSSRDDIDSGGLQIDEPKYGAPIVPENPYKDNLEHLPAKNKEEFTKYEPNPHNPSRNNYHNFKNYNSEKKFSSLPELNNSNSTREPSQNTKKPQKYQKGSIKINQSKDSYNPHLNSQNITKYFDCLRRRDPILSSLKMPEGAHYHGSIQY